MFPKISRSAIQSMGNALAGFAQKGINTGIDVLKTVWNSPFLKAFILKIKSNRYYTLLFVQYRKATWPVLLVILGAYYFCLPDPLFSDPTCMVLDDRDNNLLGARIAEDGQYRFPFSDSIPDKYAQCLVTFEDRRFYYHPGVDPISLGRALLQNIKNGRIVSGGSTITMQTIRLARKGKSRNMWEKLIEAVLATRLEWSCSKRTILALYAANAPFGGNVVGLEAASWRYFGKNPRLLSWGEAAILAVLPNNPALIRPGKNDNALRDKRNRLLDRLVSTGIIDAQTASLAKDEALPDEPHPLPRLAPHLLDRCWLEQIRGQKGKITRLQTTLQTSLQVSVTDILSRHHIPLKGNGIHNMSAIVLDVETGETLAYVGNVPGAGQEHGEEVDIVKAPRSTGSLLKPFLLSLMIQDGEVLPQSLLPDIPTQLSGYQPENFHVTYDGVVSARRALVRSLNIPFVRMLQRHGLQKFHFQLQQLGMTTLRFPAEYYGLPIILGGAEGCLWDLTNMYACMARTLNHYYTYDNQYDRLDFRPATYLHQPNLQKSQKSKRYQNPTLLGAGAIWSTFDCMQEVERPDAQGSWEAFRGSRRIAWKTGTSYGFRDAWAIGVTPQYAVGVWVGNADGEGRPGLIGIEAAAPILFDIFDQLPQGRWFDMPANDMMRMPVCKESGYRCLPVCDQDSAWVTKNAEKLGACPYHQLVHLDNTGRWQVNDGCELPGNMIHQSWFVLPPVEEYYHKNKNPNYRPLPPFRPDCLAKGGIGRDNPMQMIYPKFETRIYLPVDLDGQISKTVFKVAHRNPETPIYWNIDREFVGTTTLFHEMELRPSVGKHVLTLVDKDGNRLETSFEILSREGSK